MISTPAHETIETHTEGSRRNPNQSRTEFSENTTLLNSSRTPRLCRAPKLEMGVHSPVSH